MAQLDEGGKLKGIGSLEQMGFEFRFEVGKGVNISEVRGKRVPEFGSRAAESSATHGAEPGGGHREMEGGGRPEGARGGGDVEEIRQVGGARL